MRTTTLNISKVFYPEVNGAENFHCDLLEIGEIVLLERPPEPLKSKTLKDEKNELRREGLLPYEESEHDPFMSQFQSSSYPRKMSDTEVAETDKDSVESPLLDRCFIRS